MISISRRVASLKLLISRIVIGIFFLLFGNFLLGPAGPLETAFGIRESVGVLSVFLFWLYCLFLWGNFLSQKILGETNALTSLSFGVILFFLLPFLLSSIGLLGNAYIFIFWIVLAGSIFQPKIQSTFSLSLTEWTGPILIIVPIFIVVILSCLILHPYQDVYAYHLFAPLIWWQSGKIFLHPHNPFIFGSGYWEYLNFWPLAILGAEGKSLFSVQIFAQLIHGVIGFGGFVIGLISVQRARGTSSFWSSWGALLVATTASVFWVSSLAKNDFGGQFLFSVGLYLTEKLKSQPKKKEILLAALFFGFAIACKFTLGIAVLAYLAAYFFSKRELRIIPLYALGISLALSPILIRNFLFTNNPVFPFLMNLFGTDYLSGTSISILQDKTGVGASWSFDLFLKTLFGFLKSDRLFFTVVLFIPILALLRAKTKIIASLASIGGVALAMILMKSSSLDPTQARLFVPITMLGIFSVSWGLDQISQNYSAFKPAIVFVAVIVLVLGTMNTSKSILGSHRYQATPQVAALLPGGPCVDWIYRNIKDQEIILSLEEDAYYLMPQNYISSFRSVEMDLIVNRLDSAEEIITNLRKKNIRYLMQNINVGELPYYRRSKDLWQWIHSHKQSVLFSSQFCTIIDLSKTAN